MPKEIDVLELKRRLDQQEDFIFVDVREPHEYEEFNLGAKLIPLGTIPEHLDEFQNKDADIVLHCRSGGRSGQAQRFLEQQGYTNVTNVMGGVLAWREHVGDSPASA